MDNPSPAPPGLPSPWRIESNETIENPEPLGDRYSRPVIGDHDLRVTVN